MLKKGEVGQREGGWQLLEVVHTQPLQLYSQGPRDDLVRMLRTEQVIVLCDPFQPYSILLCRLKRHFSKELVG